MTDHEIAEIRAADHETLSSIRSWLRWFAGGGFLVLVTAGWFAAQGWSQIERNASDVQELRGAMATMAAREAARDVAAGRVEARLESVQQQLSRIERTLDLLMRGERE